MLCKWSNIAWYFILECETQIFLSFVEAMQTPDHWSLPYRHYFCHSRISGRTSIVLKELEMIWNVVAMDVWILKEVWDWEVIPSYKTLLVKCQCLCKKSKNKKVLDLKKKKHSSYQRFNALLKILNIFFKIPNINNIQVRRNVANIRRRHDHYRC